MPERPSVANRRYQRQRIINDMFQDIQKKIKEDQEANLPTSALAESTAAGGLRFLEALKTGEQVSKADSAAAYKLNFAERQKEIIPTTLERNIGTAGKVGAITSEQQLKAWGVGLGLEPRAAQAEKPVDIETKRTRLELLKEQLKRTREQKPQSTKGMDKYLMDIDKFGKIADESKDENITNFALKRMETSIDSANVLINGKKLYPQLKTQQVMDLWGEWESVLDEFDSQVNQLIESGIDENTAKNQAKTDFEKENGININQVKQAINALKRPVKANITKKSW